MSKFSHRKVSELKAFIKIYNAHFQIKTTGKKKADLINEIEAGMKKTPSGSVLGAYTTLISKSNPIASTPSPSKPSTLPARKDRKAAPSKTKPSTASPAKASALPKKKVSPAQAAVSKALLAAQTPRAIPPPRKSTPRKVVVSTTAGLPTVKKTLQSVKRSTPIRIKAKKKLGRVKQAVKDIEKKEKGKAISEEEIQKILKTKRPKKKPLYVTKEEKEQEKKDRASALKTLFDEDSKN